MSKTDISLLLSLLCALDLFLGAVAALVIVAFVAGVVFERQRHTGGEELDLMTSPDRHRSRRRSLPTSARRRWPTGQQPDDLAREIVEKLLQADVPGKINPVLRAIDRRERHCAYCGRDLPHNATSRRKYCGAKCRVAWNRDAATPRPSPTAVRAMNAAFSTRCSASTEATPAPAIAFDSRDAPPPAIALATEESSARGSSCDRIATKAVVGLAQS